MRTNLAHLKSLVRTCPRLSFDRCRHSWPMVWSDSLVYVIQMLSAMYTSSSLILLFGIYSMLRSDVVASTSVRVTLESGIFSGIVTSGTERWLGVPYAQPPTGALRFKAPLYPKPSPGRLHNASQFGNACPQPPSGEYTNLGAPISEDCLVLNVRVQSFNIQHK